MKMAQAWPIPEGLRVLPDGSWRVGDHAVVHEATLRFLKQHLVFEDGGAFVVVGAQRLQVSMDGPAFEVNALRLDPTTGSVTAILDDGSQEEVAELASDPVTARIECRVRNGRARARLSRAAHQALLPHLEQDAQGFALRVGSRAIRIRS